MCFYKIKSILATEKQKYLILVFIILILVSIIFRKGLNSLNMKRGVKRKKRVLIVTKKTQVSRRPTRHKPTTTNEQSNPNMESGIWLTTIYLSRHLLPSLLADPIGSISLTSLVTC